MENIRVNRGIEICVNDNGDSILFDIENLNFYDRFASMMDTLQSITDEVDALEREHKSVDAMKFQTEKMKVLVADVDVIFGEGSSEKIFGVDVIPTVFAFGDFISQLIPIINKYSDDRNAEILKRYNPNRKGGKR